MSRGKPTISSARPPGGWIGSALAIWLAVGVSLAAVAPALAQMLPTQPAETEQPKPEWQPPNIADLSPEWWSENFAGPPDVVKKRLDQFIAAVKERLQGLDADSLASGQTAVANLSSLVDLLQVTRQGPQRPEFEAVLTRQTYTLDDLLSLRGQLRGLDKQEAQLALQTAQNSRQVTLLEQRRDRLLRDYQAAAPETPSRILVGINRVATRVEYEIAEQRDNNLHQLDKEFQQRAEVIKTQLEFARSHLDASGVKLADVESTVVAARARVTQASENVAAVQRQLLTALSSDTRNTSLESLRKQQLTRSSADLALASIQGAEAEVRQDWYRLRQGQLPSDFDPQEALSQARRINEEALREVEVWSAASQDTLVSPSPGDSPNALANFELARAAARDTLEVIDQIRDHSDALLLLQELVSNEVVESQSGLSKTWAKLKLATRGLRGSLAGMFDYTLFSIGETPVTPGGIVKMLLILGLAYAISWFIRHGLQRLQGRRQFANSPAIYTLGRMLHYIIILVGVLAALASIGMDFTNFALIAGALSVGIGFGLQAIVNNFVSGLILLFEGSLRVGDYIELDSGLAGVVKEINTRATIVNTNDAVDVVVPNSELVTTKLTNWTLRESVGRIRIPFGVAYGSDKEKVREAALEAVHETEFVLHNMPGREPQVRLVNFGDSALEFQVLAWVSRQGVRRPHRVRGSFLWALETKLTEAGIQIPFPQRDIHIRSDDRPKFEIEPDE